MKEDEFYIGWQSRTPPQTARTIRNFTLGVLAGLLVAGGLLGMSQNRVAPGFFDFGNVIRYEGTLAEWPLPFLRDDAGTAYLLVGAGKFGPPAVIHGHDGMRVAFNGTLIQRGEQRMLEVTEPDSFEVLGAGGKSGLPDAGQTSRVTLRGELVDTKCWSGVMRPATGKVHRGCAIRCLSGGVPPGLMVRDEFGNASVVFLVAEGGGEWAFDPEWAALELEAVGNLTIRDRIPFLEVDSFEVLGAPRRGTKDAP